MYPTCMIPCSTQFFLLAIFNYIIYVCITQMYSFPPLAKRVVKDRSKFVESKLSTIRGAYRCWDTVSMQKAVEEGMPLRQAAEIFFVPKSSLHDRVTGKVDFGARSGSRTYLSYEEEEEIASFLIQTAKIGYPHTKKQVGSEK